jgi:hypothetical protein
MMLALVSGSPRAFSIASDQASWFWPVGVWFCAVGCGVSPELDAGGLDGDVGACVGVGLHTGVGLCVDTGPDEYRGLDGLALDGLALDGATLDGGALGVAAGWVLGLAGAFLAGAFLAGGRCCATGVVESVAR